MLRARIDRREQDDESRQLGFEEFVQRRRAEATFRRQKRVYLALIAVLAVACIALAAANMVLAMKLTQVRGVDAAARTAIAEAPPAAPPGPVASAPEPSADVRAPAVEPAPAPAAAPPPASEPAGRVLPDRGAERPPEATTPEPRAETSGARTAAWLVQTYGRDAARQRAQAAARFYDADPAAAAYWRDVLARIDR